MSLRQAVSQGRSGRDHGRAASPVPRSKTLFNGQCGSQSATTRTRTAKSCTIESTRCVTIYCNALAAFRFSFSQTAVTSHLLTPNPTKARHHRSHSTLSNTSVRVLPRRHEYRRAT
ncbi:hypothetical protein L226DRAFT_202645 [Lentinus tigrinus ALCF2SS1-7]|uniref:uncharacterized protein n=1 Tax=Lentinus tigrinus ALCF2SS1-7 TaxID=1328758 RepID=UPI001166262C|nr:hypothetical protein L226DRAFT_202645 [Lentinus tigrinus ALCF2SS1-7]